MENSIIATENLTRRYGPLTAVDQVNLQVQPGSIFCFLGPNGAGKTTTIRMLLGLVRPTSGRVCLFGQDCGQGQRAAASRVGSLVEAPSFYPHLTGRENLELVRRMRMADPAEINKVLAWVGLEKDSRRLVRHYSLGMCQRLGLAIALLGNPELLVLDEPTNGLDPAGIHEIRNLLRALPQEHGISVFVSSHLLSEVEQIATHLAIIQKGRLLFQGVPDELRAAYREPLTVGADRPAEACEFLGESGWQAIEKEDGRLLVQGTGPDCAAELNARLVGAGFRVFELSRRPLTLEEIFLQMTSKENQPKNGSEMKK